MEVAEHKEIVIVGGGICGLATALALNRKGISTLVLERADTLRDTGAAIGIQTNGWRALDQLGVGSKLRQTAIPLIGFRDVSANNVSLKEVPIGVQLGKILSKGYDNRTWYLYTNSGGSGEARCLKRSVLMETLANDLPIGTVCFGCRILTVKLDAITSYPILQLQDGRVIKAKVVIGCDGVNSVVADFLGLKPPRVSPTSNVRGFTNYPSGHGFSPEFVTINKDHVFLGRIPLNDKLVYWFIARPRTPQDSIVSKDPELMRNSSMESITDFPNEMVEMVKNSELTSLTLTGTRYRAPWDLLLESFRKSTITVAGDAMHVMGPFLGQGGSAAQEDAVVLARCLAKEMCVRTATDPKRNRNRIEAAMDQYVRERRLRLVHLSTKVYTIGSLLESSSLVIKIICIVLMIIFFRDRLGHTRYGCGKL